MTGPTTADPNRTGPLDRATADALLARADSLLAASDFGSAQVHYQRLVGFPDPAITGAALLGAGEALYRLDDDASARWYWEQATKVPENPTTYAAWRQVAAARVREGELRGAYDAYREAERRAPAADRAEVASRLGWLSKELGDTRGAGRYFARSRGQERAPIVSYLLLGVTILVSIVAMQPEAGDRILGALLLDKAALAHGEWWRLISPILVHGGWAHLFFNMYFLFLVGPLVEQLYGSFRFLVFYVVTAATASAASYLLGGPEPSVGASGALFGLCGVLLVSQMLHRPVLRGQQRAILSQIGLLVIINLVFGFGFNVVGGNVDNLAHVGGLAGGLWLGLLIPPTGARTMPTIGTRPGGGMPGSRTAAVFGSSPPNAISGAAGSGGAASAGSADGLLLTLLRWAGVVGVALVAVAIVVLGAGRYS
jgi:membrane associated rhomboid family serine protease